jgi:hypothetical protein
MCRPPSQSSRHIPCAVHLEPLHKFDCERHGGACLLLWSVVDVWDRATFRRLNNNTSQPKINYATAEFWKEHLSPAGLVLRTEN